MKPTKRTSAASRALSLLLALTVALGSVPTSSIAAGAEADSRAEGVAVAAVAGDNETVDAPPAATGAEDTDESLVDSAADVPQTDTGQVSGNNDVSNEAQVEDGAEGAEGGDDAAPQADAIAVADLDTSGAVYVSGLKVREQTDGVGPFDADDEAGNDSGESNLIVRSFDSISYTLEYATALADTSRPADSAVLDATFTLPYSPKKAHFDDQTLNWMVDKRLTYVYADGSVSETWDKEREVTAQVLTGKRLLEGKSTDDRVPGAGQLSVGVVVAAAVQGETIQPTFSLVAEGTDKAVSCEGEAVTVSSRPRFNVAISQGTESKRSKVYVDWETGEVTLTDGGDTGLDQGYIHTDMVGFALWNTSADKGLKGLELPTGDIHLDLRLNATLDGEDVTTDPVWGSMLWDYCEAKSTTLGKLGRLVSFRANAFPGWGARLPYGRYGLQQDKLVNGTWQNGEWSLQADDSDPTLLHVTITGCDIDYEDLTFPQAHTDYYGTTTPYFPANVGYVSVGSVQTFTRFPRGVDATRTYHRQITCESIAVDTATAGTVTEQEKTTDDTVGNNVVLYVPGTIVKYVCYGGNSSWNTGDSVRAPGQDITAYDNVSYQGDDPIYAYDVLHKFDPSAFDLKSVKVGTWSPNDGSGDKSVWYAAKPDGSKWSSDEEQRDTTFEQLVYYRSLEELEADGKTCVGVMLEARGGTFLAGRDMRLMTLTLTVRDDAQAGSVPITTSDVRVWRDSGEQASVGDTACGAGFGQGDWSWEKKKANVPDGYTTPWYYMYETSKYEATKYQDGNIVGGHTTGCVYGDSCLIVGAKAEVDIAVADMDSAGKAKTCYDLDAGERTVTFRVSPIVKVQGSSTRPDGSGAAGSAKVTVTIPSDLTYIAGSSTIEPESVTVNDDGTTTLVVDYDSVTAGESMEAFDIRCTIGAAGTDHDVDNNQQISASAKISCTLDQRKNTKANGNLADTSFVVVRLAAVAASKTVTPEEANLASSHTWTLNFGNSSQTGITGCVISDVMPYDGDAYGSSFGGAYRVTGITLDLSRAPRLLERLGDGAGVLSYTGDAAARTQGIDAIVDGTSTAKFKSLGTPTVHDGKLIWSGLDLADSELKAWKMELGDFYGNEYVSVSIDVDTAGSDGDRIAAADGGIQRAGDVYANGYAEFAEGQAAVVHSNTVKTTVKAQDITVTKAWEGDEGHEKFRPTSVKATVSGSDGTSRDVQLSAANNWTATLAELPYFDEDGNKIEYSVSEPATTDDYESTVTGSAEEGFTITNKWVYEATGSFRLTGTKNLTGREFESGDTMVFHVEGSVEGDDALACPMPSGIDANGNLSVSASSGTKATLDFGSVDVTSAYEGRTLVYKVTETAAAGRNVSRDETVKTFKVKVSDPSHNHALKLERSGDEVEFTNTFTPDPVTDSVSLSKKLTGRAWKVSDSFAVSVMPIGTVTAPLGDAKDAMATVASDLAFTAPQQGDTAKLKVGDFTFRHAGTYVYRIDETDQGTFSGVTNERRCLWVTFTVTQDAKTGNLSVSQSSKWSDGGASGDMFVNSYAATGEAKISVTKTVNGGTTVHAKDSFGFELLNADGEVIGTTAAKAGETATFEAIKYKLADAGKTFTYTIREKGEDGNGWTLAKDATVKVSVSDNGDGTLACKVDYGQRKAPDTDAALFDNTYEATGEAKLGVAKTVNGEKPADGAVFSFSVEAATDGAPMPEKASAETRGGEVSSFGKIAYTLADAGKTYEYTIRETTPATTGWTMAEAVTAKVTVGADNGDGTLGECKAEYSVATADKASALFDNKYEQASGEFQLALVKTVNGETPAKGKLFSFSAAAEGADADSAPVLEPVETGEDGVAAFAVAKLADKDEGKTYTYRIHETSPEQPGWTNAADVIATVEVSRRDADNKLTATVSYKADTKDSEAYTGAARFDNEFTPAEATVRVKKTVNGGKLVDGESFSFTLTREGEDKGQTVEIGAAAGEATFGALVFEEPGTYTYTLSEGDLAGAAWGKAADARLTFEVTATDGGHALEAKLADAGDARVNGTGTDAAEVAMDNTYTSTCEAVLSLKKEVMGGTSATMGKTFSFELVAGDDVVATASATAGEAVSFAPIAYTNLQVGEHTYTIREVGELGSGWTKATDVTAKVTVAMGDDMRQVEVTSVEYSRASEDGATALFTNAYASTGALEVKVAKTANGGTYAADKEFELGLFETDAKGEKTGEPVSTVKVKAGQSAVLSGVKYDQSDDGQTYRYVVSETSKDGDGWTNAPDQVVEVKVTDNGDGTMTATPDYGKDEDSLVFDNTYACTGELELNVAKTANGGTYETDREFELGLFETDESGAKKGEPVSTVKVKAGETATLSGVFYDLGDAGETIDYVVSEISEAGDGWANAPDQAVKVAVTDDGDGTMTAAADYGEGRDSLTFDNTYKAAGELGLNVAKTANGGTYETDREFELGLFETDESGAKKGEPVSTAKVKAGETATLSGVFYDLDNAGKTITYVVSEISEAGHGWTNAPDQAVKVAVADNGDGTMAAAVDYGEGRDSLTFDNTYKAAGTASIAVAKQVNGADPAADARFSFSIAAVTEGAPMPKATSATTAGAATASFGDIAFGLADAGKTYEYEIRETTPATPGWTMAGDVTVRVTVGADNGDGTLGASRVEYSAATADGGAALFNNTYEQAAGEFQLSLVKTVNGSAPAAGRTFAFSAAAEGANAAAAPQLEAVTTGEDGSASFSAFALKDADEGKTYTYRIHETTTAPGYTNAPDVIATVAVSQRDADNKLTATVTYRQDADGAQPYAGAAEFDNAYACAGELELNVTKTVNGGSYATDKEFEFGLFETDAGGEKVGDAISTVKVKAGETATLTGVFYDLDNAGETIGYVVSEISEAGDGWANAPDQAVKVAVTDDGDGTMTVEVACPDGSDTLAFDNAYEAAGSAEIRVTKTVNGSTEEGKEEEFRFELYATDEEGNAAADAIDAVSVGVGQTVSFGKVAYTLADAGKTYEYVIKEIGHDAGAWEQAAPVKVSVSVEDNGDGTLSCKVAYSNERDGAAWFDDKYTEPAEPEEPAAPEEPADPDPSVEEEEEAPTPVTAAVPSTGDALCVSLPALAAAGAGLVALALTARRKKEM